MGLNNVRLKNNNALLCFSHLRWNFVYQRPQHLMTRFATEYKVLFIEEPIYISDIMPSLCTYKTKNNISVLTPHIPQSFSKQEENQAMAEMLKRFISVNKYNIAVSWYFTPMMREWSRKLLPQILVYDCMDELSAFKNAPQSLKRYEKELFDVADLVFTGGSSLYKAKSAQHESVHLFPSSVDTQHFGKARNGLPCPADQQSIANPRIGFYGVIDERLDLQLLQNLATVKPDWNFIIIGPVVKISNEELPRLPNIHYLGAKTYNELPYYLSSWDAAFIPFAINESTRFISPTKTPEFLAGGKAVVSTPITDIVDTYSKTKLVQIAHPHNIAEFVNALEFVLTLNQNPHKVYAEADRILNNMSWDTTVSEMHELMLNTYNIHQAV